MSNLRLPQAALALGVLLTAPSARAGVPSPPNCTFDHVIIASMDNHGANSGPAPCTAPAQPGFDVWVRDFNNLPVAGATVSVEFAGTGTGIRPYTTQNPGVTVDCQANRRISTLTDANGHAVMVPRFGGFSKTGPSIPVYASGMLLGYIEGRSPDYDADGVVTLADFAHFSADYSSPTAVPESDFDDCPSTRIGDFGFFAEQYLWDQGHPVDPRCP